MLILNKVSLIFHLFKKEILLQINT